MGRERTTISAQEADHGPPKLANTEIAPSSSEQAAPNALISEPVQSQVSHLQRMPANQQQAMVAQIAPVRGNQHVVQLLAGLRRGAVQREEAVAEKEALPYQSDADPKEYSSRFSGDKGLEDVSKGAKTIKKGDTGTQVTRLQQALFDMGYLVETSRVNGTFDAFTESALKNFQTSAGIAPPTGIFDQATIKAMDTRFDTRSPYINNAKFDPADPNRGTRTLSADDKTAVKDAMVPARGVGGSAATFQDDVGGKKYGDEIRDALTKMIKDFHKELYEDKEPLRADPAKNFHQWSTLEQTADASRDVTDALYGSYRKGPKMVASGANPNFIDQWEDEIQRNSKLKPGDKKDKAEGKVWYLINSNCTQINKRHSAVPSDTKEKPILDPIVASLIDTPTKVQTLLDLDIGWEGAQLEGTVYLQRYKSTDNDANRKQMWTLFHTCIHEYIHSLADPAYQAYANKLRNAGDETRYNTLIEGMDDFFTENVRKTVKINEALQKKVEGPYFKKGAPVPAVDPDTYDSKEQAEQVVSIVGIRNAEGAYFQGKVNLIGG